MADLEILALNESTPRIEAAQSGDRYLARRVIVTQLGTITDDQPQELSATWNNAAVTFKGRRFVITDTASAAGSLVDEFTVNGTSLYQVTKTGVLTNVGLSVRQTNTGGAVVFSADATNGTRVNAGIGGLTDLNSAIFHLNTAGIAVAANIPFCASNTNNAPWQTKDCFLERGALGVWQIRSGTGVGASMATPAGTATVTSNVTNLVLDSSRMQRLTGASTPVLTGIAPPAGGAHVNGNQRWIYNVSSTPIQVNHNDSVTTATVGGAVASAANRLFFQGGANITLGQNECLFIEYDSTDNGSGSAGWRARKLSN